jgi:hypothetical protein
LSCDQIRGDMPAEGARVGNVGWRG